MESFKFSGQNTRLIRHEDIVYKIKVVYTDADNGGGDQIAQCDANIAHDEIVEAIEAMLNGCQPLVKTDHFLIHTEFKPWKTASLLTFTMNGRRLTTHPRMMTIFARARTDLATNSMDHQAELHHARPKRQKYVESASSPESSDTNRRYPRRFVVEGNPSISSPSPKKVRASQKRASSPKQQSTGHRHYLLRKHSTTQQRTTEKRRIGSQDMEEAPHAKIQRPRDAPMTRARRITGCSSASDEARAGSRQETQDSLRDTSQQCDIEPRVAATAGAEPRPAYPRGGNVQHNAPVHVLQHAGRHDREQYQLNEQMRLQMLAGNQLAGLRALENGHDLRPRGSLQQMVNAVMTPVRKLFS